MDASQDRPPPALDYDAWEPAEETLHLWCQIVAKTKLALTPHRSHWWNVPLYVSARGRTTHRLPAAAASLEIEIDLVGHRLHARTKDAEDEFALVDGLSVVAFHDRFTSLLAGRGRQRRDQGRTARPSRDHPLRRHVEHARYDPTCVRRYLEALQSTYEAGASLAGRDLASTRTDWCPPHTRGAHRG